MEGTHRCIGHILRKVDHFFVEVLGAVVTPAAHLRLCRSHLNALEEVMERTPVRRIVLGIICKKHFEAVPNCTEWYRMVPPLSKG